MEIEVLKGIQTGDEIEFIIDEKIVGKPIIPAGKMITDSEKMTFVYLIDDGDVYGHIHFKKELWPFMAAAAKFEEDPVLLFKDKEIKLTQFVDELTMLVFNIEGNHNYGEAFSVAVEKAFTDILNE